MSLLIGFSSKYILSFQFFCETKTALKMKFIIFFNSFIFLGSKITADSDGSLEIKRRSLLGKSYDKPGQCIKKQRHKFADKSPYSQSYSFLVVIYECESWTIKKAEH